VKVRLPSAQWDAEKRSWQHMGAETTIVANSGLKRVWNGKKNSCSSQGNVNIKDREFYPRSHWGRREEPSGGGEHQSFAYREGTRIKTARVASVERATSHGGKLREQPDDK